MSKIYNLQIINNKDLIKSRGHDMISFYMLKLYGKSFWRPFKIIFKACLCTSKFPLEWKKSSNIPFHEKNDKQIMKNCCPLTFSPIFGKIFEGLIYDATVNFFSENNVVSPNQS